MGTWLGRFREEPLGWPYRAVMARLTTDTPDVATIAAALDPLARIHFGVSRPSGRRRRGGRPARDVSAYDRSIVEARVVPTREDNDHDLANALAWAVFPASKAALHARQLVAVQRAEASGTGGVFTRTPEGDALAMLDEGGIAVVVHSEVAREVGAELLRGDDQALGQRARDGHALGIVFGHGLLEHLGRARSEAWRPMAGLAVALPFAADPREVPLTAVDLALAARVADPAFFATRTGNGIASAVPGVLGLGR